ncbi:DNA polymerase I [uncultured Mailhella sp.]|uniref:DNA polymerase I n=1 Tax=uncultured Mailhella sp. TaxID=1981031 RepID=UPI0025EEBB8E|nr:DNA polymerase I [uncultured Mailhella sp.]
MSLKQRLGFTEEPLYVMDGNAFLFRGFFANSSMSRSDGFPTGALHIVGRVLLKLLREERPKHFVFVMDGHGRHFRHEIFPAYKANRPPAPEGLVMQIEPLQNLVRALGMKVLVSEGCEADDCIASLAARYGNERPVVIIGMDKDLRQCLSQGVVMWDPASREEKIVTLDSFREETGLEPSQWPDVQALIGDTADNVPGVKGIGAKTAEKLFRDFRSLEDVRDRMAEVPPSIRKKLEGNEDAMFLYRELTRLHTDCCAEPLKELSVEPMERAKARTFLREFEMNSLLRELDSLFRQGIVAFRGEDAEETAPSGAPSVRAARQLSLFDEPAPVPVMDEVTDPSRLPACAGLVAAVTPAPVVHRSQSRGLCVAVRRGEHVTECLFSGDDRALVAWAGDAALVVTPDLKRLLHAHAAWGTIAPSRFFDLGLAAYLLAPEDRDYGWPSLSARQAEKSGLPMERPASIALSLHDDMVKRLEHDGLLKLLRDMEMPLIPVLVAMEDAGITIDKAALKDFLDEVQSELDALTERIYKEAGQEFNIRSAQQIGEILFKKLGLAAAKSTKGGQASTSQAVLEKLSGKHPVVDALLEYRKLEKMRSTYLEPLPRLAGPDNRIHTTFNQTATATGRLSSSNPNLQNIPVRGELGRRMRTCFTAGPGMRLISADYSQVELRVLAHYSEDPTLIDAFRNGEDIHTRTAALLHDVDPSQIGPDERRKAKTINFGLIYGMGARKLGQDLGIPMSEAKMFIERYFARFAHIKEFFDSVEKEARKNGYVTTISGRRRPLPDMLSQSGQARALAERQAVNTLIQGSAADLIKLAMLAVYGDAELRRMKARLLLQIHDELIVEAPEEHAEEAAARLARLMTDTSAWGMELRVPLVADAGIGRNWGEAH